MSFCFKSNPPLFFSFLLIFLSFFLFTHETSATVHFHGVPGIPEREYGEVLLWKTRRSLAEETVQNSTLILAEKRTHREDPLDDFKKYQGGWNISNKHYWASVGFTAAPFFVIAVIWFVVFALSLCFIFLCYCCCRREPYGYSRACYALSLILLIFFTVAAIVGCIVLYTGQGKFHGSTVHTLDYVVHQANITGENLRNVSGYLAAAKTIGVNSVTLAPDVQNSIDQIDRKINSSTSALSHQTNDNSKKIKDALDSMRLALIVLAAVMLFLAFLGFLFSIFGMQCLVYFLVVLGWILVTGTFILCGIFLLLHNVVGDTCVAMDEWVQNPTARTALDDILPCMDNATAQETLSKTKDVTRQLVTVVDNIIINVANKNFPPQAGIVYYNQSGPMLPVLCNPFNHDLTNRQCVAGEVDLNNATEVWKNYICQTSPSGICTTPGRLTPALHHQMAAAVNVSFGLYRYGPFLVNLQDCTFVRDTFTDIKRDHCPGLRHYSKWIYIGLVMVSAAVMLSLIFWVIYARERRHRVYTKQFIARSSGGLEKAP
ncbi:putative Transmembrane protein [Melia azedarach]|uniref:Transmembrane protein n=1 Tax=Melia azedarach TaxID=155640 RepID=A0ACC1XFY2_MELAZ|nr:putative Transmembrane protein [Melia azedarach]